MEFEDLVRLYEQSAEATHKAARAIAAFHRQEFDDVHALVSMVGEESEVTATAAAGIAGFLAIDDDGDGAVFDA